LKLAQIIQIFTFQELVSSSSGYQKLFEALKSLGQPTRQILDALVAMALGREDSSGEEEERMVRNVEPVACLVDWLPAIEDQELQIYLASTVNKICSSSLQRYSFIKNINMPFSILKIFQF